MRTIAVLGVLAGDIFDLVEWGNEGWDCRYVVCRDNRL